VISLRRRWVMKDLKKKKSMLPHMPTYQNPRIHSG
jgi:hypothetical protein